MDPFLDDEYLPLLGVLVLPRAVSKLELDGSLFLLLVILALPSLDFDRCLLARDGISPGSSFGKDFFFEEGRSKFSSGSSARPRERPLERPPLLTNAALVPVALCVRLSLARPRLKIIGKVWEMRAVFVRHEDTNQADYCTLTMPMISIVDTHAWEVAANGSLLALRMANCDESKALPE